MKAVRVIGKALGWTLAGVVGLVALVVFLLYLPPVQDLVVSQALGYVNKGEGMKISVKKLRLYFPLELRADSLRLDMDGMDMEAGRAEASVALLPLFGGCVFVPDVSLSDAAITMGTPDSTLYMLARLSKASLSDAEVGMSQQTLDVRRIEADGGEMSLRLLYDTVAKPSTPPDTTVRWRINLHEGELKNLSYRMQYLPTIDSLDCSLVDAVVKDAFVSLADNTVKVKSIDIKGVDAAYLTPSPEYLAAHPLPPAQPAPVDTAWVPWRVSVDKIHLSQGQGLYATAGVVPLSPNFDPSYISVSEIDIQVDSFWNRGMEVRVPITRIYGRERSGIPLTLTGLFDMDQHIMRAQDMNLTTPTSRIALDATLGMEEEVETAPLDVKLQAEIGPEDLRRLVPPAIEPFVKGLPPYTPLKARAEAEGSIGDLAINTIAIELPGYINMEASGRIADMTDLSQADGWLKIKGSMRNGSFLKPMLLDAKMQRTVNLPPLTLAGNAKMRRGVMSGDLKVATEGGHIALDAEYNSRAEGYDVALRAEAFPVQSFMPTLGLRDLTAQISAKGRGFNLFSPKSELQARVDLHHAVYNKRLLENSTVNAEIARGKASVEASSRNPQADFTIRADGNLDSLPYRWNFDADVRHVDLLALGMADTTSEGSIRLGGNVAFRPAVAATRRRPGQPMQAEAALSVASVDWRMGEMDISATDLGLRAVANDTSTLASLTNHDLKLLFDAPLCVDSLMARLTDGMGVLDYAMHTRQLQVDSLQRSLPTFYLQLDAGDDNILASYLKNSHISFDNLHFKAQNGKEISASGYVTGITAGMAGTTHIDSVAVDLLQEDNLLGYQLLMENQPGTFDEFAHVVARGAVSPHNFTLTLNQKNIKGETGYSLGAVATMPDTSTIRLKFVPFHPIIGYKDWEVNKDNFITYNFTTHHFDANLDLRNTLSYIQIYTNHPQPPVPPVLEEFAVTDAEVERDAARADSVLSGALSQQEDLVVKISNILLSDWISLNPFAPQISGSLSADLNLSIDDTSLNGKGTASLTDFTYGRKRVGTFDVDLDLSTNAAGTIRAGANLKVDGKEVLTASGNLNDSTARSPFLLDMKVIHFPLQVANPFLPPETATLRGTLNGRMDVTGELSKPVLNGSLTFDSAAVKVYMIGTDFLFSPEEIPVENSVVTFNNFTISGCNNNPLTIDGTVDIASFADPVINLDLSAQNMMVVNSQKRRNVPVFGKGYIDLDGSVHGPMHFLKVNANLSLLSASDVTYVVQDLQSALASRSNQNLVKFVNFADTSAVENADTLQIPETMMVLNATLNLQDGATINVDLSANGRNKVQVLPAGKLTYVMAPLGETLNGRININGGFVRYTPPLMSEKLFDFNPNSYVAFNGDMMNPTLNVSATDVTRVNVTTGGNSRMVDFDISAIVTGTLEQMNVTFDVSAPSDVTVQNELQGMSQQQRASQAMNLLLYNVYSGPGNTADFSAAGGNPLFSFLESRLNSWASSAIKGVDLTFGIDQFDKTVDGVKSTATSYSYQVSKSLFDNRFKIVVGGNYTDDPQANENFAQNLIADISFEYMLNKRGTMYIRLFRHTGYESILEGEITQTGVGFVYKRKIMRISDMFRFARRKPKKEEPSQPLKKPADLNEQTTSQPLKQTPQ